jgi:hypothetical protein
MMIHKVFQISGNLTAMSGQVELSAELRRGQNRWSYGKRGYGGFNKSTLKMHHQSYHHFPG